MQKSKLHHGCPGQPSAALLTGSALMLPAQQAAASGFPVVDIAALTQSLQDFVTQNSQLAEEISQYQQMLTDYQLMYENLRGYTDMDALKAQFEQMVNQELKGALKDLLALDPKSGNYPEQVGIVYDDRYGGVPDNGTLNGEYGGVFDAEDMARIEAAYQRDRRLYERYKGTLEESGKTIDKSKERKKKISEYTKKVASLGPQQEMMALQLLNLQTNMLLQQLEQMSVEENQQLVRMEEKERKELEGRVKLRKKELDRIKTQTEEKITDVPASTWLM